MKNAQLKSLDASDERQYMLHESYEVYEKHGAPTGAINMHYHHFYEIIYVLEGEYSSLLGNQTYHLKTGDFLLIDCNVMHKYQHTEKKYDSSKRIILWITPNMLEKLSDGEMDLTACFRGHESCAYHFPIYYEEMLRGYLLKLAMSDILDMESTGAKEVMDRGYLTLLFVYLNMLCSRQEYLFSEERTSTHPLVDEISKYIDTHISEPISVEDLANLVHMSKYHFLRKFKDITGVTVHTFITNKRLIRACEMLKSRQTITQVYQACGFSDYSAFLRNFKKNFGVSPGKYLDFY